MTGPIDLMRSAAVDAERAEALYQDASFRNELREGRDVFRTFEVTTLPIGDGRRRRQIPSSWQLRLDPVRVRPLL